MFLLCIKKYISLCLDYLIHKDQILMGIWRKIFANQSLDFHRRSLVDQQGGHILLTFFLIVIIPYKKTSINYLMEWERNLCPQRKLVFTCLKLRVVTDWEEPEITSGLFILHYFESKYQKLINWSTWLIQISSYLSKKSGYSWKSVK